jgi:hypothetical protein
MKKPETLADIFEQEAQERRAKAEADESNPALQKRSPKNAPPR